MKRTLILAITISLLLITVIGNIDLGKRSVKGNVKKNVVKKDVKEITGTIKKGESFFDIFRDYKLDLSEFLIIKKASANVHTLKVVHPGQTYRILLDEENRVKSFVYYIDDDNFLNIERAASGFQVKREAVAYEKRVLHLGGSIRNNLISSMGDEKTNLMLALELSDIFAWDIDFNTDIRDGDTFKIVVEGMYLDGEFKKYGSILAAQFVNDGNVYSAYKFVIDKKPDYYNGNGESLKKAFLKAPLSFRYISSSFSKRRFHPILKIVRPHHGVDYAAPDGTPVSAIGNGKVIFAGVKGQYGKLIVIRHKNGFKTYYGHLSRITRGIKRGANVEQGQIIGRVGSTGLATGPHLHFEMRLNNRPVNPRNVRPEPGKNIPIYLMANFKRIKEQMDTRLASISSPVFASMEREGGGKKN